MYKSNAPTNPIDPIEECQMLKAENAELRKQIEERDCLIEELKKMMEKMKHDSSYWQMRCDEKDRELQIRDAQMEVVQMIFGRR